MHRRYMMLSGLLLLGTACTDNTPRCSPDGEVAGCLCHNGRIGAQRCGADGILVEACVCPPEDGGADGAVDAVSSTDVADAGSTPKDAESTDLGDR